MENNYKEFIQKIKYMVEYDTSKTREDNQIITEDVEEVKEVITEAEDKGAKGREYADEVIAKCRAKMKSMSDDEVEAFRERINDAFGINEGVEVNELMSKTTQDGWDEKTSSVMSEDEMELMKVAKELVNLFKGVGMKPALMSPAGKVIGDSNGDLWIQVQENPQRESEMWISFRTSNPTSDLNKFGPSILSKFKNLKLINKDGDSMSLGLK